MSNCAWCWQSNPYDVYDWDWCEVCEEPICSPDCLTEHLKDSPSHPDEEKLMAEAEARRDSGENR